MQLHSLTGRMRLGSIWGCVNVRGHRTPAGDAVLIPARYLTVCLIAKELAQTGQEKYLRGTAGES
jgi:hypothetical protein